MVRLQPACETNNVPIVFSANSHFVPYTAVMLRSLLAHASAEKHYDIILLHSELTEKSCGGLLRLTQAFPNCTLRFYDVTERCGNMAFFTEGGNGALTKESYYRLLIGDILSEAYDKAIYLDGDMVACADVSGLLETDLDGYYLAAVPDLGGIGLVRSRKDEALRTYWEQVLRLQDPETYFNAGVLVFHLQALRRDYPAERLLQIAASRNWQYHDQDVLNFVCRGGGAKLLDPAWNMLTDYGAHCFAPPRLRELHHRAENAPRIVHYAGKLKPWNGPVWRDGCFWQEAALCEYFAPIVCRMADRNRTDGINGGPDLSAEIEQVRRELLAGEIHPSWAGILERLSGQDFPAETALKYCDLAEAIAPDSHAPERTLDALAKRLPDLQAQFDAMLEKWPQFWAVLYGGCRHLVQETITVYYSLPLRKRRKHRELIRQIRLLSDRCGTQEIAAENPGRIGRWEIALRKRHPAFNRVLKAAAGKFYQIKQGKH